MTKRFDTSSNYLHDVGEKFAMDPATIEDKESGSTYLAWGRGVVIACLPCLESVGSGLSNEAPFAFESYKANDETQGIISCLSTGTSIVLVCVLHRRSALGDQSMVLKGCMWTRQGCLWMRDSSTRCLVWKTVEEGPFCSAAWGDIVAPDTLGC